MKASETVLMLVAATVLAALSASISWTLATKHADAIQKKCEEGREIERSHVSDLTARLDVEEKTRMEFAEHISSQLSTFAVYIDARLGTARRTVAPAAPRSVLESSAHWWCYFGRECFRSKEKCVGDDDARADECQPAAAAFCAGKKGDPGCYRDIGDCIEAVGKLATYNGYGLVFPDDVQQNCVRLE